MSNSIAVHVGTIDLEVDNLVEMVFLTFFNIVLILFQSAKINLDAQVLNLLSFNAGVDLSIDEVRL